MADRPDEGAGLPEAVGRVDGMEIWVDHIVYAVPDLDAAVDRIVAEWGVQPTVGGSHDGRGTRNVLLGLGARTYLEVIGPDPAQGEPELARPFGVDLLEPSSHGSLAGWAMGTSDIDRLVRSAATLGFDSGPATSMTRSKPDGSRLEWRLTLSGASGGGRPFFIDWGQTPSPALDSAVGASLQSFTVTTGDAALGALIAGVGAVEHQVSSNDEDNLSVTLSTPRGDVSFHS